MALYTSFQRRLRLFHRTLAPVVLLPVLMTLITGSLYQIALLSNQSGKYFWLMRLHRGDFFLINLDQIYPFLIALCLLVMTGSGISMWIQMHRQS